MNCKRKADTRLSAKTFLKTRIANCKVVIGEPF